MTTMWLPAKTWWQGGYFLFLVITVLVLGASLWWYVDEIAGLLPALPATLLPVYGVTLLAYWIRTPRVFWAKWLGTCLLPLLLVSFCYVALTSLMSLPAEQFWLLLPVGMGVTYFNLGATIFAGKHPLDRGRLWRDGKRLLGDGKTVEGTVGGLVVASVVYVVVARGVNAGMWAIPLAMLGDIIASFGKRRWGWVQGEQLFLLDQLDGIALFLCFEWWGSVVGLSNLSTWGLVWGTFFVQAYGNVILYLLGKKSVPW